MVSCVWDTISQRTSLTIIERLRKNEIFCSHMAHLQKVPTLRSISNCSLVLYVLPLNTYSVATQKKWGAPFDLGKKVSSRTGFEPVRENPIGFRVQRLNHSAIVTAYGTRRCKAVEQRKARQEHIGKEEYIYCVEPKLASDHISIFLQCSVPRRTTVLYDI